MASVGQLGGLNYKIRPLGQPTMAPGYGGEDVGAIAPPDVAGLPNDRLADRQGQTAELFNKYRMLDSFAKDMAKKGIDVFTPDYSQPDGGLPYQTFLELDAGVRYAANKLANEQKAQEQLQPLIWQSKAGLADGVTMDTANISGDPSQVVSYEPTYATEEANKRLFQNTETAADSNALNEAVLKKAIADIDADPTMSPEQKAVRKAMLFKNVPTPTAFRPLQGRAGRGPSQEDILRRAELIKQIKRGIVTQDPTPLNILRVVPGVEDVQYVNDGDRTGIEVFVKGGQPTFIDLSAGGGEGEINALLTRIEGQLNVPNEKLFEFDTSVPGLQTNAREVVTGLKGAIKKLPTDATAIQEVLPKLQELANSGQLATNDMLITSLEVDTPAWYNPFREDNRLSVTYHPLKASGDNYDYSKTKTKVISDPAELESIITANANKLVPIFGGQLQEATSTQTSPSSNLSERQIKAIVAFETQKKRKPTEKEVQQILAKYK